jgi:hypothetical protein
VAQVVLYGPTSFVADSDDALLVPLATADVDALAPKVYVVELQADQLAGAKACVKEGEGEGPVPGPLVGGGVAAGEEAEDVLLGEGVDDLLGDLDVLDLGEGAGGDELVACEPGEEGARLALSAPLGDGGDAGAGDMVQEPVDVGGGERGRILRQLFLMYGSEEDLQALPVGADGFGGLALDAAGGEIEPHQAP